MIVTVPGLITLVKLLEWRNESSACRAAGEVKPACAQVYTKTNAFDLLLNGKNARDVNLIHDDL